jgi:uncharacterized membrane protein YdbT with pleckstrin-like domain
MSYAKSVLQPNEQLVMVGKLHWIIFGHAILWLFVGTILVTAENIMTSDEVRTYVVSITVVVFGIGFLITFVHAWFIRWITEFSVTDRRVIYKRGFINRHTAEMNMDKVESVDVDQSMFGRLLGYGTIHVLGTGQGIEHLHRIAHPIELRNAIIAK